MSIYKDINAEFKRAAFDTKVFLVPNWYATPKLKKRQWSDVPSIMEVQLRALLRPLRSSQHYRIERLKEELICYPMMVRDASLSDSKCIFLLVTVHTEKSFRNLIISNRNQIAFTIFQLIWNQTDDHLVPNQAGNGKYNLISVWFNMISKKFLCV